MCNFPTNDRQNSRLLLCGLYLTLDDSHGKNVRQ